MMQIKTLILDDDPLWQQSLSKLVLLHPSLQLVGIGSNALEGYQILAEKAIDLLICDIEMPEVNGIEWIKNLTHPPLVVLVTSHQEYALDGYEISPVDFLVKPLDVARFFKSIDRVKERLSQTQSLSTVSPYLFIREQNAYIQIPYHQIEYMESEDNILKIITPTKIFQPILTIGKMEQFLKGDVFIRIHRSFLVNREAIVRISKNEITTQSGKVLPIGDQYRDLISQSHIKNHLITRQN